MLEGAAGPLDHIHTSALMMALARLAAPQPAAGAASGEGGAAPGDHMQQHPGPPRGRQRQQQEPLLPGDEQLSQEQELEQQRSLQLDVQLLLQLQEAALTLVRRHATAFAPRQLSNVLYSLARQNLGGQRRLVSELVRRAGRAPAGFTPQGLSTVLWALGRLDHPPPATWRSGWLAACSAQLGSFNGQDLATTAWAIGWLGWRPPAAWMQAFLHAVQVGRLQPLVACMPGSAPCMPPGVACDALAHACAGAAMPPMPTMLCALPCLPSFRVQLRMPSCRPEELVTLAWGVAACSTTSPGHQWMHTLVLLLQPHLDTLDAQQLAMLAWACGRWRHVPNKQWLLRLQDACKAQRGWTPQGLCLLVWALARLSMGEAPKPRAAVLPDAGNGSTSRGGSAGVAASAAQPGADLGSEPSTGTAAAAPSSTYVLAAAGSQEAGDSAAGSGHTDASASSTQAAAWMLELQKKLAACPLSAEDASMALLAAGQLGAARVHAPLTQACVDALAGQLHECSPQQLANTAWALGRLGTALPSAWTDQLLKSLRAAMAELDARQLIMAVWGLSQLQVRRMSRGYLLSCIAPVHGSWPLFCPPNSSSLCTPRSLTIACAHRACDQNAGAARCAVAG